MLEYIASAGQERSFRDRTLVRGRWLGSRDFQTQNEVLAIGTGQ
jgi:hypothetical protein